MKILTRLSNLIWKLNQWAGACADCGLPYEHPAWVETVLPNEIWAEITPAGHPEAGLLCCACIDRRLANAGKSNVPVVFIGVDALRLIETNGETPDVKKI